MKVLIVKKKDSCWPFVEEQVAAIRKLNELPIGECRLEIGDRVEFVWHLIEGKGMMAYVKDAVKLMRTIRKEKPDVIHAHYGLSGYYVCLAVRLMGLGKKLPVVVTYHGSDINEEKVRKISQKAIRMAAFNIFVSPKMLNLVATRENSAVIPCGIDWADWPEMCKEEARASLGWRDESRESRAKSRELRAESGTKYVLFSSDFQTEVKNPGLAKQAVALLNDANDGNDANDVELIELIGYTRAEVNRLMHAVDVCLMTSKTEGSPQFIKEAMACGCPIVTTDVGDARFVIGDTEGCYVVESREPRAESQEPRVECVVEALQKALAFAEKHNRTNGRKRIQELGYSNDVVAAKIKEIYLRVKN